MNTLAKGTGSGDASRRGFLKMLVGLPLMGAGLGAVGSDSGGDRVAVNALLISATTVAGRGSLEHAREQLRELYGERRLILLINFASLPGDRDAYEARMQRDFRVINPKFEIRSLHRAGRSDAAKMVRESEGIYVSGGNTFLLLRELYDLGVVDLLREHAFKGVPYAGSSAGSNIAGEVIGTTNDFPITDVPTRRSLGLFGGVYNPHHPREEDPLFGSRQWKIGQYCAYNTDETVVGVPDEGMLRVRGNRVTLMGEDVVAYVQRGEQKVRVISGEDLPMMDG